MCAVGRCIDWEYIDGDLGAVAPTFVQHNSTVDVAKEKLDSILKPEYKGLPMVLWTELQKLHDSPAFWDKMHPNKMSALGQNQVKWLKKRFAEPNTEEE